jgi:DNA-binding NarL/FixJ family response regulator
MKAVVIVADSALIVETVRLALRATDDLDVIGHVDGRTPVSGSVRLRQPAVVLVDEMQGAEHAIQRIAECRDEAPDAVLLAMSARVDQAWAGRALAAGADACLSRSTDLAAMSAIIRELVNRNVVSVLPPPDPFAGLAPVGKDPLSEREREIVTLVADGLTNARIGKQLCVAEQTVKFHLSNIYRKLGVSNRTEASRYVHLHVPAVAKRVAPRLVPDAPGSG